MWEESSKADKQIFDQYREVFLEGHDVPTYAYLSYNTNLIGVLPPFDKKVEMFEGEDLRILPSNVLRMTNYGTGRRYEEDASQGILEASKRLYKRRVGLFGLWKKN